MTAKAPTRLHQSYLSADIDTPLVEWLVAVDLPRTTTGKVRKFALPDLIAQGSVRELSRKEPQR